MPELPFRQVHLDFHTAKQIPGVGSRFDRARFGAVLKAARVNSINLFAKCHHGMYYYPTTIGTMHPSLGFDLLGEQIAACRENGIRACIYTCVVWNEDWADRHPEWLQVNPEGVLGLKKPFTSEYYSWRWLCLGNAEYVALLKREFDETWNRYRPAGYWIDIILQRRCVCPSCLTDMRARGMDPRDERDLLAHDRLTEIAFMKDIFGHLKAKDPSVGIYFNGHPYDMDLDERPEVSAARKRELMDYVDIESLPSDSWGYTHFPIAANFLNWKAQEITMMNGKFHKAWGDFGSLRNPAALEFECFRALANGAKVCVGDQLHPGGALDETVYARIGEVFAHVEAREGWCAGTRKIARVGVFSPSTALEGTGLDMSVPAEGVYRMLAELHVPFDFVDYRADLAGYDLLVLPDSTPLTADVAGRISARLASGAALIATGRAGLDATGTRFLVPELGVEYVGPAEFTPRYARVGAPSFAGIPPMDYVFYEPGTSVRAAAGTEVLAGVVNPYFNRTWEHFCSHRQTPPAEPSGKPCITLRGRAAYVAQALFRDYAVNGNLVFRQIFAALLDRLLSRPVLRTDLPPSAECTLRQRGDDLVVHLLAYVVQRRCRTMDIVEERLVLDGRSVSVRCRSKPRRALLAPQGALVPFAWQDGYATVTVPRLDGHLMLVLEGAGGT